MRREFRVELTEAAEAGLAAVDSGDQRLVVAQLRKLRHSPELGKPLRGSLVNYRKMYAARKRVRLIYSIQGDVLLVTVIAIGAREDAMVYAIAEGEVRRLRRIG